MTSSPRHVLIVVENLPLPLDRRVWLEATTLVEAGYQVSVICPAMRGWTEPFEVIDGVHIWRHPAPFEAHSGALAYAREYGNALRHWFRLAREVRRARGPFQVIHGCNPPISSSSSPSGGACRGSATCSTTTTSAPSCSRPSSAGAACSTR